MSDPGGVVLGLVMLAGLVGAVMLMRKGTNAGFSAFNRKVLNRKEAEASDRLTGQVLQIDTVADAPDIIAAIRGKVTWVAESRSFGTDLVETLCEDDALGYVYGNKFGTVFTVAVTLEESTVAGAVTKVSVTTLEWTLDSGIAARLERLQRLRDEVLAAVRSLDPAAKVSYRPAPPAKTKR